VLPTGEPTRQSKNAHRERVGYTATALQQGGRGVSAVQQQGRRGVYVNKGATGVSNYSPLNWHCGQEVIHS